MKIFPGSYDDCSLLFNFQITAIVSICLHWFFSAMKFLFLFTKNLLSQKSNLFNSSNISLSDLYLFPSCQTESMNWAQSQFNQYYLYELYSPVFRVFFLVLTNCIVILLKSSCQRSGWNRFLKLVLSWEAKFLVLV